MLEADTKYLTGLAAMLQKAADDAGGAEADSPEGTKSVVFSATLTAMVAAQLREILKRNILNAPAVVTSPDFVGSPTYRPPPATEEPAKDSPCDTLIGFEIVRIHSEFEIVSLFADGSKAGSRVVTLAQARLELGYFLKGAP